MTGDAMAGARGWRFCFDDDCLHYPRHVTDRV